MTKEEVIKMLSTGYQDVVEFEYDCATYYRNTKIRDYLNKLLSADLKAVFTESKKYNTSSGNLDWSGEKIIMVNAKSEVCSMQNSEWAFIGTLQELKYE